MGNDPWENKGPAGFLSERVLQYSLEGQPFQHPRADRTRPITDDQKGWRKHDPH